MYLSHFGLRELPFSLTPDTAFAFSTQSHQKALNTLLVAANSGEGFIKITGEVGTGKTLLCRRFLRLLVAPAVSCYLPNPNLTPRTLLLSLAEELGETLPASADPYTLHKTLNRRLIALALEGRRVVVCIDEAQALSHPSLEALRLLSNLETEKRKLMQVIVFGQPELDEKLERRELRQLRQRIAFSFRLEGMGCDEVGRYVQHRLRIAGQPRPDLFSRSAIDILHRASGGTPRLVNVLAHKALLCAYGAGAAGVDTRHARAAAQDSDRHVVGPRTFFGWRPG